MIPEPYKLRVVGFDAVEERWIGTLLTLGNGRLGVRGELELAGPRGNASFYSGLYNDIPIWRRELVALPAVNNVYIHNLGAGDIAHVERLLDMRRGVLYTEARIGEGIEYRSECLAHRTYKNLFMQRIRVRSEDEVTISLPIERSLNPFLYGYTYAEHLIKERAALGNNRLLVCYRLGDTDLFIEVEERIRARGSSSDIRPFSTRESAGFSVKGRDMDIEKYATFYIRKGGPGQGGAEPLPSWEELFIEHTRAWARLWDEIGLEVKGPDRLAGAVTFYTYHLLQLIDEEADELMISARGLHGIGYRGHIFWDTDLYLLPFLSLLYPDAMRKVLNFRCRTLEKALEYARETGYGGARYPWESADDGRESTPRYYPSNLDKCECIDILTGEQEIHVTGDIAFAAAFYYKVTGDKEFLKKCGLRLLVETARFWASRVEYDEGKGAYVIRNVVGPDEYYVGVDNNFFTNFITKYNLEAASNIVLEVMGEGEYEGMLEELGVDVAEAEKWREIAGKLFSGRTRNGVIEEFEGFFEKARLSKQADVVLALLLKEVIEGVDPNVLERNYRYYLRRTTHESSLSLPIFAAAALALELDEGRDLFLKALGTDLENAYGNTHDGFHVAAAGGIWYAILFGLLGIRLRRGKISYSPRALNGLRISLNIKYRGEKIRISPP